MGQVMLLYLSVMLWGIKPSHHVVKWISIAKYIEDSPDLQLLHKGLTSTDLMELYKELGDSRSV